MRKDITSINVLKICRHLSVLGSITEKSLTLVSADNRYRSFREFQQKREKGNTSKGITFFSENIPPGWTVPSEFSPELLPENSIQMVSPQYIFESDDVAKSCPVSYRTINQYGGTTCRHSFSRVNPDTIGCVWTSEFDLSMLPVDGEIFESGKKKLRIQKYPDTCAQDSDIKLLN